MKNKHLFIGSISAFAGILLVILLLVSLFVVQDNFLKYTNHKYRVHENLAMSSSELDKAAEQMVAYVKGQIDSPQVVVEVNGTKTEFFNQKEIGHLQDVRELIGGLYIGMACLFLICIAGEVALAKKKNYSAVINGIFIAWAFIIVLAVGIGIIALIDIDFVITGFHELFLADSAWVLNPSLDRSVWMFMTNMYQDVLIVIGAIVLGTAFVSMGGALVAQKKIKDGCKNGR